MNRFFGKWVLPYRVRWNSHEDISHQKISKQQDKDEEEKYSFQVSTDTHISMNRQPKANIYKIKFKILWLTPSIADMFIFYTTLLYFKSSFHCRINFSSQVSRLAVEINIGWNQPIKSISSRALCWDAGSIKIYQNLNDKLNKIPCRPQEYFCPLCHLERGRRS